MLAMIYHDTWPHALISWFHQHKRTMPWREDPSPYKVWVSEMMLQQTQVATVLPYFDRFLQTFPTLDQLAAADEQQVLKAWEGLGYYTRARNLHKAARQVVGELGGRVPDTYEALQQLPGLGPYAAAAIASIAFGQPVPSVDGNFLRVFARFWGVHDSISSPKVRREVFDRLASIIVQCDPSAFNQGVMELGAMVCKPRQPKCSECPLARECVALSRDEVAKLPVKDKAPKVPHLEVGAAIVWHQNKILITQRPDGKMLAGLWEFPGGKQEPGETMRDTIIRELKEETCLVVDPFEELGVYRHAYSHFTLRLHAWHARVDEINGLCCETPHAWVLPAELERYPFPEVDRKIIRDLIRSAVSA